ncbi:uncharacterized protein KY384_006363 [Bacidia gigantensis]|uniref:uncharacterized protein n=1 Tax=Bacidia gigantensis TaxID=2732470 RepID=UPI001D03D634|nr:uncharacterized protein KY384_006363 [Bacidia gigantensis]KAG8528676.1 hypothetical protein KY384_006363 [Bacidia gigantensis]
MDHPGKNASYPNNIPVYHHASNIRPINDISLSQSLRHRQLDELSFHSRPAHLPRQHSKPLTRHTTHARPDTTRPSRAASLAPSHPLRQNRRHRQHGNNLQQNRLRVTKPPRHSKIKKKAKTQPLPLINYAHLATLWSSRYHDYRRWIAAAIRMRRPPELFLPVTQPAMPIYGTNTISPTASPVNYSTGCILAPPVAKELFAYFGRKKYGPQRQWKELTSAAKQVLKVIQDHPDGLGTDADWAERVWMEGKMGKVICRDGKEGWGKQVVDELKIKNALAVEWLRNHDKWMEVYKEREERNEERRKRREEKTRQGEGSVNAEEGPEHWYVGEDDLESNWEEILDAYGKEDDNGDEMEQD